MTKFSRILAIVATSVLAAACERGGGEPVPSRAPAPASPAPATAQAVDPRGQIFIEKGCIGCHKVTKLGVQGGELGPDLSFAASDVKARFGTDVESFLKNPTGTMQIVLSQQIKLTEEEREDIAELLEDLGKTEKADK